MKRNESQVDISNPFCRFVDEVGSELCWFSFLITGDWQLSVEVVVGILELESIDNPFSPKWTLLRARRLVAAASVAAISPDLMDSTRRAAEAAEVDPIILICSQAQMWACRSTPTRADLEKALLAIDAFPRCAVLLTVLEGLSIQDAVLLLNTDEELVRGARTLGLVELVRNIALSQSGHGVLFSSRKSETSASNGERSGG